ncbi:MAG: type III PLP-dependent enzyme [Xanthomonadales bacterium]|nr:type III PLP-dependent enzyme [Xanthomonadales bacterium]
MNVVTIKNKQAEAPYRKLVEEHGSPLVVLDCAVLRTTYRTLQAALPGVELFYAIKSLPAVPVLKVLQAEGANFDIATTGEIQLMQQISADPKQTIHTHPIKRDQDIRDALEFGCSTFVVDNPDELAKFQAYAGTARLLLRVSFRAKQVNSDLSRKFGCAPRNIPMMLAEAKRLGIEVIGLSFHVGSQCLDTDAHVKAIQECRQYFDDGGLEGSGKLRVLDIGGGFPADYAGTGLDLVEYCRPIVEALADYPESVRIIAEPGRVLSAPCITAISTVVGRAERIAANWYYLDDGLYGSYSGQIYDHTHYPLTLFSDDGTTSTGVLTGPTCDSIDVILEEGDLPNLQIGDLVVGNMMGAYTLATSCEFNSLPLPKLVVLHQ